MGLSPPQGFSRSSPVDGVAVVSVVFGCRGVPVRFFSFAKKGRIWCRYRRMNFIFPVREQWCTCEKAGYFTGDYFMSIFKLHSIKKKNLKKGIRNDLLWGDSRNGWPLSDAEKHIDKRFSNGMGWWFKDLPKPKSPSWYTFWIKGNFQPFWKPGLLRGFTHGHAKWVIQKQYLEQTVLVNFPLPSSSAEFLFWKIVAIHICICYLLIGKRLPYFST